LDRKESQDMLEAMDLTWNQELKCMGSGKLP